MTYYNADVGVGGANQPLSFNPQAVADSSGNATYNFPTVPNGQIWTGTVTVIGAPDSATFTMSSIHVGNDIGQFIGGNNWGPLQLQSGDQLIITATGLIPGTAYVCNFQGTGITGGDPGITYPEAYAHSVTTRTEQIVLGSGSFSIASGDHSGPLYTLPLTANQISYAPFALNPSYRSLYVAMWFQTSGFVKTYFIPTAFYASVFGAQSNQQYDTFQPSYLNQGTATFNLINGTIYGGIVNRFAIVSGVDTSVGISAYLYASGSGTNVPSGTTLHWVVGADLAPIDSAIYSETPAINQGIQVATNYGAIPIENIQYLSPTTGAYVVDPIIVAGASGGTPIPISGSVTTVSGSTTAVTNTSAAPLYVTNTAGTVLEVQGIAGGVAQPISGTVTNTVNKIDPDTNLATGTTASALISVKTSAGQLYGVYLFNPSTTANAYLQVWNALAGSITIGTTAPRFSFGVPFGGGAWIPFPEPISMTVGITIAATTTRAGSTYATTGLDYDIIYTA